MAVSLVAVAVSSLALHAAQPHPLMREYNHAWQLSGQLRADEAIPLLKQIIAKDKTFYRAYGTLADAYRQKQELDKAEQYFRSLLAQDPKNGQAHYGLGRVYEWKEQSGLAAGHYTDCIEESPQTYPCYSQMVKALQIHRKHPLTIQDLQPRPLQSLRSPFRELLLASMHCVARSRVAVAETQAALGLALSRNDPELVAVLEDWLGGLLYWNNDYWKAVQHLEKSLQLYRQLEDLNREFEIAAALGGAHCRSGNFDRARIYLEGNLALARKLRHPLRVAGSLQNLGEYYKQRGDQQAALRSYREAIQEEYEALKDQTAALDPLLQIGSIYEETGELARARESFAECRAIARKNGRKWHEAFALRRLGDVYRDSGEYVKSLESLTEAVRMFRENGNSINVPAGLRVIASVHSALGNYSYARDNYEQSLSEARAFTDTDQQERTLQGLGRLYLRMKRPKQALEYLQQALSISDRTGNTALRSGTLRDAGDAYRLLGDPEAAIVKLNEALRIARQLHIKPDEAAALAALGLTHLDKGRVVQSEAYFHESLALAQRTGIPEVILAAREGLTQICLRRGTYAQALQHLRAAIETVESLRARIPTPELRSSFVQQNLRVYEAIVDVLARLHARDPAAGYDRQAFAYLERGRARGFLDSLAESKASVTKGLTTEQVRRQNQLHDELSKASAALLREGSESNRRAVENADRRMAEWALEIRGINPRYHELEYPRPYDAAKAQSALAATGAVILEYELGERQSLLWIVTGKQTRMIPLPGRAEVERQVASFRAAVTRHPKGDFDAWLTPARRLYKMLIGPVEVSLRGVRNLVIVPDEFLYYLPFESLVSTAEGVATRFLIEDHAIAYAPSATVFGNLLANPGKQVRPRSHELLAYGDPAFGSATAAAGTSRMGDLGGLVRGVYQSAGIKFPQLPNTRAEVEAIGALYPPPRRKIYLGADATEASVKSEQLSRYTRVHFATHAVLDEQVPARSGVVLSLGNTGDEDGILRTNEIFNLELNADLVVLSACQTGLGTLVKGEGMVGLTRAFLYAGSPRVVVSLWEVNDHATADFMKIFYQKMKEGQRPGFALRAAKLDMLHSGSAAYRHPYFWTPFVLVGRF